VGQNSTPMTGQISMPIDSIIKAENCELSLAIAECTIDQLLDDGLLKDIPWIGWIFKAKAAYASISDRILLAKVVKFLLALQFIDVKARNEFANTISTDDSRRKVVGTQLLIALDKINDIQKADILAAAFCNYIEGHIDYSKFTRIAQAIEQAHIDDIRALTDQHGPNLLNLLNSGLSVFKTTFDVEPKAGPTEVVIPLELSSIGKLLKCILEDKLQKAREDE
jgi:hypothetical protein